MKICILSLWSPQQIALRQPRIFPLFTAAGCGWTIPCWNGLCASNFARQALNRLVKFNILAIQTHQPKDDGLPDCLPVKPGKNTFGLENQIHTHIA